MHQPEIPVLTSFNLYGGQMGSGMPPPGPGTGRAAKPAASQARERTAMIRSTLIRSRARPADSRFRRRARQARINRSRYMLLRFFDFNVEPGRQYVYRVMLVLRNPELHSRRQIGGSGRNHAEAVPTQRDQPRQVENPGDPVVRTQPRRFHAARYARAGGSRLPPNRAASILSAP